MFFSLFLSATRASVAPDPNHSFIVSFRRKKVAITTSYVALDITAFLFTNLLRFSCSVFASVILVDLRGYLSSFKSNTVGRSTNKKWNFFKGLWTQHSHFLFFFFFFAFFFFFEHWILKKCQGQKYVEWIVWRMSLMVYPGTESTFWFQFFLRLAF